MKCFAAILALLALVCFQSTASAAEKPRNVLLIVSDDLNVGFATYGHPQVRTPNLDRLAANGLRFDRAYCNYPVCNASRVSFLSGRHPRTTGVVGNGVDPRVVLGADFQFLPEHFKARGWFTAGIGKITHTPEFLHAIQWDVVRDPQYDPDFRFEEKKAALKQAPDEEQPDGVTARTIARLMAENRDKPFFLGAGFHRPHAPRIAPQKYFDLYPLDSLELPGGATEADIPPIARPPGYDPAMSERERRLYRQSYYACVSFMDAQVGVLLEAMDRLDLWRNTVVVFLGDNGYHLGEHGGFWGKMSLMDQSGRVPLIVRAPGVAAGTCAAPVSLVDLFPTVADLCGLPLPQGLEGRSLAPLLRDPATSWDHPARSVVVRGEKREGRLDLGRSAHTARHTFIQWPDGTRQLYDDLADPAQTRNLAADPAHAGRASTLQAALLPESSIPAQRGIGHSEDEEGKRTRSEKKRQEIDSRTTTPQAAMPAGASAGVEIIPANGRNIQRLALAELDGNPAAIEIVGATYDERVCAFAMDGKHLWDAPTGGYVFDLAAGDLDGNGRDEVVAASADGWVYVFASNGELRWKQNLEAPVYQVGIAKLDGKMPSVLAGGVTRQVVAFSADGKRLISVELKGAVRMMRAGDFDGDGADEVAVMPIRGQAHEVLFLKGGTLASTPERQIPLPKEERFRTESGALQKKDNPLKGGFKWIGSALKDATGLVADLDGDSAMELLFAGWGYALTGTGSPRRLVELPNPPDKNRPFTRVLAAGDLTEEPGPEILIVDGADLQLCGSSGKKIGQAVAPVAFTAVAYLPGSPRGSVLLGSGLNGDDNLYRVRFGGDWKEGLESLPALGRMATVETHLKQLAEAAAGWAGQPMAGSGGPFDVVVSHHLWSSPDLKAVDGWIQEVRSYEQAFPYSRLRFSTSLWPGEKQPLLRPDGKAWERDVRLGQGLTREQIVAGARKLEEARCQFWVQVGHGCAPHCSVAAAAAILDAAPTMCLGFVSAEDEQAERMGYYYEHHIQPILELCLKHGKHFIPRNNNVWWACWPAHPELRRTIFSGKYRSVLLPCGNDTGSRVADLQLAARIGLWLDGQADNWATRLSKYMFGGNVTTGHPHLRYYVSQALLGARVFAFYSDERDPKSDEWSRVGLEGAVPFLHLLGRGAITPPRREQLRAISPVVLHAPQPTQRFVERGANGHADHGWNSDGTDVRPWAFDRLDCYWDMAPLPSTDVATYLWGRTRRDHSHVPVTAPQGLVCMVPGPMLRSDGLWRTIWTTDGDKLSCKGKDFTLAEARAAITPELAEAAKKFPFAVTGRVFHQIIEQTRNHYILALVDPGWLDPADRDVKLAAQTPGHWRVADRLTGKDIGLIGSGLSITVPAGTLRLLELRDATQSPERKSP